jgi:hypothetical protein
MSLLTGAAKLHKKKFYSYLDSTGVSVNVRLPLATNSASNSVTRALGKTVTATGPIGSIRQVRAIVNFGYTAGTNPFANPDAIPPAIRQIGTVETVDAVLRCRLEDVLVVATELGGRTLFDSCKDVVYQNTSYTVLTTDRTGLPPEGPYIVWVALRSNGAAT